MAFHIDVKISPNQTVHSHILCVLEGEETGILMGQVSKKNKNKNKKNDMDNVIDTNSRFPLSFKSIFSLHFPST